jgi:hypothetical protein
MTDLERYLCLATWGLWGERKKTVRLELESHIRHKAWKYQVLGLDEAQAIARALTDLGQPQVVSAGMNQVYTMPNLLRNAFLSALLCSIGFSTLNSSAQVVGTSQIPIKECEGGAESFTLVQGITYSCTDYTFWLSLPSLRATLELKGVKFSRLPGNPKTVRLRFPGATSDITLSISQKSLYKIDLQNTVKTFATNPDFIPIQNFIEALKQSSLPVRVSGWNNPRISVGDTTFTLDALPNSRLGDFLYIRLIDETSIGQFFPQISTPQNGWVTGGDDSLGVISSSNKTLVPAQVEYDHHLRIRDGRPGDVFLILSREGLTSMSDPFNDIKPRSVQIARRTYIAHVGADNTIIYKSPSKRLSVIQSNQLTPCVNNGDGTIAVLRFSGRIDSRATETLTKVAPADVTVQALR